jgi:hypothetical protein
MADLNSLLAVQDHALTEAEELEAEAATDLANATSKWRQAALLRAVHGAATSLKAKEIT